MTDQEPMVERLARQARALVGSAGAATERFARLGRLQVDRLALQRERGREAQTLGERVIELLDLHREGDIADDPIVVEHRRRIAGLDATMREHDVEIDRIRNAGSREHEIHP